MKDGKGPIKGLLITAGVLAAALVVTVFSFLFVSAGNAPESESQSASRYVTIGEGTTPHSKSTRKRASSESSSVVSLSTAPPSSPKAPEPSSSVPATVPPSASASAPESVQQPASTPEPEPEPEPGSAAEPQTPSESESLSEPEPDPLPASSSKLKKKPSSSSKDEKDYTNWKNGGVLTTVNVKEDNKVYHTKNCESAQGIQEKNKRWNSIEYYKSKGYHLCENCAAMED